MGRLPENMEYQQHLKQKARQAGEASATDSSGGDAADAGHAAAGNRDSDAMYANVSGLPPDNRPAGASAAPAGDSTAATRLTRDRNLSGIVRTIQDEGPSDYAAGGTDEAVVRQAGDAPGSPGLESASAYAPEPETGTAGHWPYSRHMRPGRKLASYGALLGVVVILGVVGAMGGAGLFFQGPSDGETKYVAPGADLIGIPAGELQPAIPGVAEQARDARLREIQQQQLQINTRLDDLQNSIASLASDYDRQRVETGAALDEIRAQQRREQALTASRFDALQKQVDSRPVAVAAPQAPADSPAAPVAESEARPAREGNWAVNLASFQEEAQAGRLLEILKHAGIPVEQQTISLDGSTRYRLRVTGFASSDEARRYAGKLDKRLGLKEPWVSRK